MKILATALVFFIVAVSLAQAQETVLENSEFKVTLLSNFDDDLLPGSIYINSLKISQVDNLEKTFTVSFVCPIRIVMIEGRDFERQDESCNWVGTVLKDDKFTKHVFTMKPNEEVILDIETRLPIDTRKFTEDKIINVRVESSGVQVVFVKYKLNKFDPLSGSMLSLLSIPVTPEFNNSVFGVDKIVLWQVILIIVVISGLAYVFSRLS